MKRNVTLFMFLVCIASFAQVGMGTSTPNPSAQLDVSATNRGILIPRIALANSSDATTITSGNVESLLVYNTATTADVTPGFYYWTENKWMRVVSEADVSKYETVTTLKENSDGTYTYSNENGTKTTIRSNPLNFGTPVLKSATNPQIQPGEYFVLCELSGTANKYTTIILPSIGSVPEGYSIVMIPWYQPLESMNLPNATGDFGNYTQKDLVNQYGRMLIQTSDPNTRIMTVDHISTKYFFWSGVIDPGTPVILTKVRNMWVQTFII